MSHSCGAEATGTDHNLEAVSGGKVMSSASNDVLSLRPGKAKRKAGRLPAELRLESRKLRGHYCNSLCASMWQLGGNRGNGQVDTSKVCFAGIDEGTC